jgi:hypothetical protein
LDSGLNGTIELTIMFSRRERKLQDAYFKAADAYQAALHKASDLAGSGDSSFTKAVAAMEQKKQQMHEAMAALNAFRKPKQPVLTRTNLHAYARRILAEEWFSIRLTNVVRNAVAGWTGPLKQTQHFSGNASPKSGGICGANV